MTRTAMLTAGRLAMCLLLLSAGMSCLQAADDPENLANPVVRVPLHGLSITRERPLFSPSRRPVPPPMTIVAIPEPPAPPAPPPLVTLLGIIADDNGRLAVVRPSPTEKVKRVRLGDNLGGWRVSQIEARRLILSLDDRSATFVLFTAGRSDRGADGSPEPRRRSRRSE